MNRLFAAAAMAAIAVAPGLALAQNYGAPAPYAPPAYGAPPPATTGYDAYPQGPQNPQTADGLHSSGSGTRAYFGGQKTN
ncbi:MAG TPA: hypothetical protein VMB84_10210 [Stellaceae bacterium]|nr:hypothetical protein [Stellaceae bacterium]